MKYLKIIAAVLICSAVFLTVGASPAEEKDFIRWIDNNVPYEVLLAAYDYDLKYHGKESVDYDFCKALAYLAVRNGNKFSKDKDTRALAELVSKLEQGKKIDDFYGQNKYYKFYSEGYRAIFGGVIGNYKIEETGDTGYGLVAYHPFPRGYYYRHYDDFGNSRAYGYKRRHLGHDMMGSVGTPVVAVEGGVVTEFGWNKYGGWRIGVRSFDKKRSYYYAHLRKNKPYAVGLKKGSVVKAGEVIGYLGVTGYSTRENTNMSGKPHLHLGMQLIFDESQYQGPTEIWVDMYDFTRLLSHNRAEIYKDGETFKTRNTRTPI
jgi:Membrane proteins related to metalloendopeptidases